MGIVRRLISTVALSLAVQVHASPLAFQGTCEIYDGKVSRVVGTFHLDHAEALAGSCPHTNFQFKAEGDDGTEISYNGYVEHQSLKENDTYAAIALFQTGKWFVGGGSTFNLVEGSQVNVSGRLSSKYTFGCRGELK